jgi:4-methylaminobutanoate oxidase (formaldehyde-forming)
LAAAGACFGEKMGFERPNWFGQPGEAPHTDYSFGRQNWFAAVAAEHRAAREAVAVFDQSSFAKFLVEGRNAEAVLQRVCSSDVALPAGRLVYTAMLNRRGGFEADLTVMRLEAHRFLLVSSSARLVRDADWIRRHAPPGADFRLTDVSDGLATIGVCGPASRILLGRLTRADLGNPAFPFGAVRELELAGVTAHAARMAYGGELGWELYVPGTGAGAVYDALMAVGIDLGVRNAGYYALDSLRLEKAYRAWGSDITPDDTPLEAGMAFIARLDKPVPFIGREALVAQKRRGIPTRLVLFVLEDPTAVPWGGEPVWRDDRIVGKTTSAAFGHTVGRPLAFGWIRNEDGIADEEFVSAGRYEIEIAGDRVPARPALRAPYDPEGLRRKG